MTTTLTKKRNAKPITAISLFCGLGGEHLGKRLGFEELGLTPDRCKYMALNHSDTAVSVFLRNFPDTRSFVADIEDFDGQHCGFEKIDMLWASPSCVEHSNARGGKPCNEQSRMHTREVMRHWIRRLNVQRLCIENVTEFMKWGPLLEEDYVETWYVTKRTGPDKGKRVKLTRRYEAGTPDPRHLGEFFEDLLSELQLLGYDVEHCVLCSADYGDPTTRRRFFLQAAKDGFGIEWPKPTHRDPRIPLEKLSPEQRALPPWRSAREIIDWDTPAESIFYRKRPLCPNTLARIKHGLKKFGLAKVFISKSYGGNCTCPSSDIELPLPTVTTSGNRHSLLNPFFVQYNGSSKSRSIDAPLGTGTTRDRFGLIEAVLRHGGGVENLPVVRTPEDIDGLDLRRPFWVEVDGVRCLVDITQRMLTPRELARAQGFPDDHIFERVDGTVPSTAALVEMIGNVVTINLCRELTKAVMRPRLHLYR